MLLSCLQSMLFPWFCLYLAATLCATQWPRVTCLLFCWGETEKQQRYWSWYNAVPYQRALKWPFPSAGKCWDRQECWDKCLFDLLSPIHPGFLTALCSQTAKAANQCSVTPVNWAVREKGSTGRRNHTYLLLWTVLPFSVSLLAAAPSTLLWARAALFSLPTPGAAGGATSIMCSCPTSNISRYREATKRHALSPPQLLLPSEKVKVIFGEGNTIQRHWQLLFHLCQAAPYLHPCCSPSPHQKYQEEMTRCPAPIPLPQENSSLFGQVSHRKKAIGLKMWNTEGQIGWICQFQWITQYLEDEEDMYG